MLRTITIVFADRQKQVFEADINTVGELRAALSEHGIDYAGMRIYEGITKTEYGMATDDTVLPHDLTWKGEATNNLVFMLSQDKKKFNNGIDRKSIYELVKLHGLADAIKAKFGKNYTNVPSDDLMAFINEKTNKNDASKVGCKGKPENKPSKEEKKPEEEEEVCPALLLMYSMLVAGLKTDVIPPMMLISALQEAGKIEVLKTEIHKKPASKEGKKEDKGASEADIEEMFAGMED